MHIRLVVFYVISLKALVIRSQTGDIYFPGYRPERTNPIIARTVNLPLNDKELYKGGLLFGPTDYVPPPPNDAFLPVHTSSGSVYMVPKVFYQKSDKKSNFNGNLNTPDFSNPLGLMDNFISANGKAENRDNSLGGIYIPMPLGLNPVAFQLVGREQRTEAGRVGLGFDQADNVQRNPIDPTSPQATTKQPDALLRFLQNAGQYLIRRQNYRSVSNSDPNLFSDPQPQPQLVDPLLYSPANLHSNADSPERLALLRKLQQTEIKPREGVFDAGVVQGGNNGEFLQKLASNIVQSVVNLQDRSRVPPQINALADPANNQTIEVGGYGKSNNLVKATGLYMSVPFLPATYLGSYSDYEKTENNTFG